MRCESCSVAIDKACIGERAQRLCVLASEPSHRGRQYRAILVRDASDRISEDPEIAKAQHAAQVARSRLAVLIMPHCVAAGCAHDLGEERLGCGCRYVCLRGHSTREGGGIWGHDCIDCPERPAIEP